MFATIGFGVVAITTAAALRSRRNVDYSECSEHSVVPGVYLVGAGPGAVDLISVRGWKLVQSADVILHDRLVAPRLIQQAKASCKIINVGKSANKERYSQTEINRLLVSEATNNPGTKVIVRLKGGDPFVYGLGGDEILALSKVKIPAFVVPGITSAVAVPTSVGVPVTQKGVATSFVVVSGHLAPGEEGAADWEHLPRRDATLVILMGTKKLGRIAEYLIDTSGWARDTPVVVVHSGTTAAQRVIRSTLVDIASILEMMNVKPPCITIVGNVCNVIPPDSVLKSAGVDPDAVWGEAVR